MWQDHEREILIKARKSYIPGMESDDVAQELRIILWKKLDQYDSSKASEKTFANTIMENRIKNLAISAKRLIRYQGPTSRIEDLKQDIADNNAPRDFASRILQNNKDLKIWQ